MLAELHTPPAIVSQVLAPARAPSMLSAMAAAHALHLRRFPNDEEGAIAIVLHMLADHAALDPTASHNDYRRVDRFVTRAVRESRFAEF